MNASTSLSLFKPVYEDTFDTIEEFILSTLYDEWKYFMETEDNYFNHNQIEGIQRSIKIRSKKLDELISQDLVRLVSKEIISSHTVKIIKIERIELHNK